MVRAYGAAGEAQADRQARLVGRLGMQSAKIHLGGAWEGADD